MAQQTAPTYPINQTEVGAYSPGGGGGTGTSNHGLLTGLEDDDHPQYHNDARGDARYATTAEGDLAASALQPGDAAPLNWAIGADHEVGAAYTCIEPEYLTGAERDTIDTYFMDQPGGSTTLADGTTYFLTGRGGTWGGGGVGTEVRPIRVLCDDEGVPDFSPASVTVGTITGVPTNVWPDQPTFWAGIQNCWYDEAEDIAIAICHVEDQVDGVSEPGAHWVGYLAYCLDFTEEDGYNWQIVGDKLLTHQSTSKDLTAIPDGGAQTFFQHVHTADDAWMVGLIRDVASDNTTVTRLGKARLNIAEAIAYCQAHAASPGSESGLPLTFEKWTATAGGSWEAADGAFALDLMPTAAPSWLGGFQLMRIPEIDTDLIVYGKETATSGEWSLYGMTSTDDMTTFSDPFVIQSIGQDPWTTKTDYINLILNKRHGPRPGGTPMLVVHQEGVAESDWAVSTPVSQGWLKPTVRVTDESLTVGKNDEVVYITIADDDADYGKSGGTAFSSLLGVDGLPHPCKVIYRTSSEQTLYDSANIDDLDEGSAVDLTDSASLYRSFRSEVYIDNDGNAFAGVRMTVANLTGSAQQLYVEGNMTLGSTLPVLFVEANGYHPTRSGLGTVFNADGNYTPVDGDLVLVTANTNDDNYVTDFGVYEVNAGGAWVDQNVDTTTIIYVKQNGTLGQLAADTSVAHPSFQAVDAQINRKFGNPIGATDGTVIIANDDAYEQLAPGADGEVLTANSGAATGIEWVAPDAPGIAAVVDDTTPQLGGDLDLNGFVLTGAEPLPPVSAARADSLVYSHLWEPDMNTYDRTSTTPKPAGTFLGVIDYGAPYTLVQLGIAEVASAGAGTDEAIVTAWTLDAVGMPDTVIGSVTLDVTSTGTALSSAISWDIPRWRAWTILLPSGNSATSPTFAYAYPKNAPIVARLSSGLQYSFGVFAKSGMASVPANMTDWNYSQDPVGSEEADELSLRGERMPCLLGRQA